MHGNVWEWGLDWYENAADPETLAGNKGSRWVARSGSW